MFIIETNISSYLYLLNEIILILIALFATHSYETHCTFFFKLNEYIMNLLS